MPQRSPVIFALLLAATLSVDAVAVYWYWAVPYGRWSGALYNGLVYGQLSVCCIWSLLAAWRSRGRWLLPYACGLVVALGAVAAAPSELQWSAFVGGLWLLWTHVTVLLGVVWLLKQGRIGRLMGDSIQKQWQASSLQLLTITTVVALIMSLWAYVDLHEWAAFSMIACWIVDNVGVAAVALVALSGGHSLIRRIAAIVGAVIALWLASSLVVWLAASRPGFRDLLAVNRDLLTMNFIQATVLVLWLELVPIIPRRTSVAVDDATVPAAAGPSRAE